MNKNISFCMLVLLGFFILIPTQALAEPYVFNTLIYLKALPTFHVARKMVLTETQLAFNFFQMIH